MSTDGGDQWEFSTLVEGLEYFGKARLRRDELQALARGVVETEPDQWRWVGMPSVGLPQSLPDSQRPKRSELVNLAGAALSVCSAEPETLPYLDRVEVWLCDPQTGKPLARARTALSLDRALAITHLGPFQVIEPWRHTPETWKFQKRLNAHLNRSTEPGKYRFVVRVYERTENGVVRLGRKGVMGRVKTGLLPDGLLAEPWESSRQALLDRIRAREPGRAPMGPDRQEVGLVPRLGAVGSATPPPTSAAG